MSFAMPSRRPPLLVSALLGLALFAGSASRAGAQAEAPDPARPAQPAAKPAPAPKAAAKKAPAAAKKAPGKAAPAPAQDPLALPGEGETPVDPYAPLPTVEVAKVTVPPRLGISDIAAMQGLLAVQRLDGWLLHDKEGTNPVALRLAAPSVLPQQAWYYLLPVSGEPVLICHATDESAFEKLAGRKVTYQGYREMQQALREALKGKKSVAMEVTPNPDLPVAAKTEAGAKEVLRALKITAVSSDHLVQYTTAVWGQAGHTAHHVAVHHLTSLRQDALAFIARQLRAKLPVSELDVQQRLVRGMAVRGVVGPDPSVAAGAHTADPYYLPTATKSVAIREGDLVSISLALKLDKPDGIFAAQTWVAFAGDKVPERVSKLFASVTAARDQAIALIGDRLRKRRPMRGYEVDQAVRAAMAKAGLGKQLLHRTGHSIDTSLDGSGADLDDYEAKDLRSLVAGTGVTVGPGVYYAGELGVRSEVTVFLSPGGPEVTTPAQQQVEALLAQ